MGKGDRKKKQPLPRLATVPRPKARGRKRMEQIGREKIERNPARVALEVRAQQMGRSKADWRAMAAQALGDPAGQALHLAHDPEKAARLWSAYTGLTAAESRYHRTCLGKSMAAKVAKIEFLPETFEARDDDQPDLRDEDERHRDAANAWNRWLGYFNSLGLADRSIIQAVSRGWCEPVRDGTLTDKGRDFVAAVEKLADVVDQ